MVTTREQIRELIEKLESLPPERIAEIEDYIDFLRAREQERSLVRAAEKLAEPVLDGVWDNPDDAVYDRL